MVGIEYLIYSILHGSGALKDSVPFVHRLDSMDFGTRSIGEEIKLFPPPNYRGEIEKWEGWRWQLKRYVPLHKPVAKLLIDEVESCNKEISDELQYDETCFGFVWSGGVNAILVRLRYRKPRPQYQTAKG